ncbi:hypothetical protein P153DRAFT_380403 [Dothidotthia symphoricarpi CBS 119687]|uniref:Uncharacterized protein n=1 Tax=Dothidotthia symphoricarpi CBS 119687 TaxID=1392245 RepID=A0A6A6ASN6_9PLEO|nr:uncharacterized protein P153DRAFT_380403 [Dothidotthia symphoricarpi CBS 119687]KAF2134586.1 hypothetical protein P153DRAFT_380403 [Dothidotthia symphoricarpi CBS 119687]
MCWITLTPKASKQPSSPPSCVEQIARVHHSPISSPRLSKVHVKLSSSVVSAEQQHHHHLHPHLHHHHMHPLHLHPLHGPHHDHNIPIITLHGSGHKRHSSLSLTPSRPPSRCRPPSPICPPAREPTYRTQIVEPAAIRAQTIAALREVRPERARGRLRRVAGYEMLGREAPWNWDCVSSSAGSGSKSSIGGGRWVRKRRGSAGGGLRYPPFGGSEKWM